MPILYTVISRKNVVLARHATTIGNFAEVTELVLSRIDETKNKKMSYSSESYMYHYVYAGNNLTYLCITDDDFKRSSAFAFLDSIESKFKTQFHGRSTSNITIPLALNTEMAPLLAAEMKKFNLAEDQAKLMPVSEGDEAGSSDRVQIVRNEVDRVKDIMIANVETLMERGERLELLVDKAENLSQNSVSFRQASRTLRRQMWWQNTKFKIAVIVAIPVAIYIIVAISCGGLAWPKCVG